MANNLAAFKPDVWSKSMVLKLDKINVMLPLVNRNWEGDLRNSKAVKIRTAGNITMATYDPTADISTQDITPAVETFTVAGMTYFAFAIDDTDVAQSDLDAIGVYTERAAVAINDEIEAKILSAYSSAHADNQVTGGSAAALVLTSEGTDGTAVYSTLTQAAKRLSKKSVPRSGRWAILSPHEVMLLREDTKHFVKATDLGDKVVASGMLGATASNAPGFVGQCAGFDLFESNNCPEVSSARYLPFGNRSFISYASQIVSIEVVRQEKRFGTLVKGLILHDKFVTTEGAKAGGYIKATIV